MFTKGADVYDLDGRNKTLALLPNQARFSLFGDLANRGAGYIISYLNNMGDTTGVHLSERLPSDLIFGVETDWANRIKGDQKAILAERGVSAPEIEEIIAGIEDGKVCQSFVFVHGSQITKAVVLIGPTERGFEFDQCLYRGIMNVFGFKIGKPPDDPNLLGERLADLEALSILYSIDATGRTGSTLRLSVEKKISDMLAGK